MKYYLFLKKKEEIAEYRKIFDKTRKSIREGVTPVFNEMASAKTNFIESFPYNLMSGCFLIAGTFLLSKIKMSEIVKMGLVLVVNNVFGTISNFVFVLLKHRLRLKLCRRMGIEGSDENIAVMESLEYQTLQKI